MPRLFDVAGMVNGMLLWVVYKAIELVSVVQLLA